MKNNLSSLEYNNGELKEESFDTVNNICSLLKPKNILEIGFNRGTSAIYWLQNSNANVISIDIRPLVNVKKSIDYINSRYPSRFEYIEMDSRSIRTEDWYNKFDLAFIDGDHSLRGVNSDIEKCIQMNIRYFTFDDYFHGSHGKDIKNAILYQRAVNAVLKSTEEFEEKYNNIIERTKAFKEYEREIERKIKSENKEGEDPSLKVIKEYSTGSGQVLVENMLWKKH